SWAVARLRMLAMYLLEGDCAAFPSRKRLIEITRAGHLTLGDVLRIGQRLARGDLAGYRRRELLADHGADALIRSDRDEIAADIRHGLRRGVVSVSGLDRSQDDIGERRRLLILVAGIERLTGSGRCGCPA